MIPVSKPLLCKLIVVLSHLTEGHLVACFEEQVVIVSADAVWTDPLAIWHII